MLLPCISPHSCAHNVEVPNLIRLPRLAELLPSNDESAARFHTSLCPSCWQGCGEWYRNETARYLTVSKFVQDSGAFQSAATYRCQPHLAPNDKRIPLRLAEQNLSIRFISAIHVSWSLAPSLEVLVFTLSFQ